MITSKNLTIIPSTSMFKHPWKFNKCDFLVYWNQYPNKVHIYRLADVF